MEQYSCPLSETFLFWQPKVMKMVSKDFARDDSERNYSHFSSFPGAKKSATGENVLIIHLKHMPPPGGHPHKGLLQSWGNN
jgi:hypothetical protein